MVDKRGVGMIKVQGMRQPMLNYLFNEKTIKFDGQSDMLHIEKKNESTVSLITGLKMRDFVLCEVTLKCL